jgi:threonine dehydrogenase-like Zn-dependent dehydrogenase
MIPATTIQATISGERQVEFIELPLPEPKGDWALVKVHASALCTEYKSYLIGEEVPAMGHEGAGEVVAVAQPSSVQVGDRVVILPFFADQYPCGSCSLCITGDYLYCLDTYPEAPKWKSAKTANYKEFPGSQSGTFAHYTLKPAWMLPKIPDDVTYAQATMAIDGIGASFGAFEDINVSSQDTVLVTGLGPVGLGAVVNARYRNARVIGVEPSPWRVQRALDMGVEAVFDPRDDDILDQILALTDGIGVDCAVDCSGVASSIRLCIDAVRRRGRVALAGLSDDITINVTRDMMFKGLTLASRMVYNRTDYPKVMQVIQESPLIDLLNSHQMPMSQIQEGFEMLARGEGGKIVVDPWQ